MGRVELAHPANTENPMSAFLCSADHIAAVVTAWAGVVALRPSLLAAAPWRDETGAVLDSTTNEGRQAAFRLLADANIASVNHLYRAKNGADTIPTPAEIPAAASLPVVARVQAAKLAHSLDYQSCEPKDWSDTMACANLAALQAALLTGVSTVRGLGGRTEPAGWDAAAWSI